MTIGDRIRIERKRANLTQKALAKATGLAEITIRNYEAGKYEPKFEQLCSLALALNLDIGYLVYGKTPGQIGIKFPSKSGKNPGDSTIEENAHPQDEPNPDELSWAMYEESKELSEDDKREMLAIIQLRKKFRMHRYPE